ncbi:hypothetical protein [Arthrobacter sp. HS15c]|uniref:hypothetical protein n=1 Tax=Arthrobacter sp. HS15c TaxID=3230279 RepID=UPI003466784A
MKVPWLRLVTLGLALLLPTVVGACASPPRSSSLRLVTVDMPQEQGMDARFEGTLGVDGNGCVHATLPDETVYTLVWPQGYTVQGDSSSIEILDASRNVVARSGSNFVVGGGLVHDDASKDQWTEQDCAKGRLWLVSQG